MNAQAHHPHPHLTAAARLGVRAIGLLMLLAVVWMSVSLVRWLYHGWANDFDVLRLVVMVVAGLLFAGWVILLGYTLMRRLDSEALRTLSLASAVVIYALMQAWMREWEWLKTWSQSQFGTEGAHSVDVIGVWLIPWFIAAVFHVACKRILMRLVDLPDVRSTQQRIKSIENAGVLFVILVWFELLIVSDKYLTADDDGAGVAVVLGGFALTLLCYKITMLLIARHIRKQAAAIEPDPQAPAIPRRLEDSSSGLGKTT